MIKQLLLWWCLLVIAAPRSVYGGNFSWRQVLIGSLALLICQFASEQFEAALKGQPFRRIQFHIQVDYLDRTIKEAAICGDHELSSAMSAIFVGMTGVGSITFTTFLPGVQYKELGNFRELRAA